MPLGCMVKFNYIISVYGYTIFSLAVMVTLYAGSKIAAMRSEAKRVGNSRGHAYIAPEEDKAVNETEMTEKEQRSGTDWEALFFNNLLLFTFLILPSISTKIIHVFATETLVDGAGGVNGASNPNVGTFLKADYSIRVEASEYKVAFVWAALNLVIFPLGIPVWYFTLLNGQKEFLDPGQEALQNTMNVKTPLKIKPEGLDKSMAFEYVWPGECEEHPSGGTSSIRDAPRKLTTPSNTTRMSPSLRQRGIRRRRRKSVVV